MSLAWEPPAASTFWRKPKLDVLPAVHHFAGINRLGVVSDTHNNRKNIRQILQIFAQEQVDLIVHTGDVASKVALEEFSHLKVALVGVWGNNDEPRQELEAAAANLGFAFSFPTALLHLETAMGRQSALLIHDPAQLNPQCLLGNAAPQWVLFGHTHRHADEIRQGVHFFNPGECAGHLKGYNAVGIIDFLHQQGSTRLVHF